jgi:chromosome segregation ATPase
MSTIGGGSSGSPEFEKLIQLATFVQGSGYVERVKELQALEASSKAALDEANEVIAKAEQAQKELGKRAAEIKQKEEALAKEQAAHRARVSALNKAISEAR